MKKIYLVPIFFLWFTAIAYSQDWRPFTLGRTSLFAHPSTGEIKAIRMDSIAIVGSDTLYFHYPTLFYYYEPFLSSECEDATYWINNPCIITSSGRLKLQNKFGDTLSFDFNGVVGDSSFVGMSDMNQYHATIWLTLDSVVYENFYDIEDSVKYFTFHSRAVHENMISIQEVAYTIKLSKSHGFFSFFNAFNSPWNETTTYSLAGMDNPVVGLQNISSIRAFREMDIGDEFHIYTSAYACENQNANIIIDKLWSIDSTSVEYTFIRCGLSTCHDPYSVSFHRDTLSFVDDFTQFDWMLSLPDSLLLDDEEGKTRTRYIVDALPGKKAKAITYCYWEGGSEGYNIEGCAFTLVNYGYGDPGSIYQNEAIQYYHKGNYTWGTPYDCDYFMTLSTGEAESESPLKIYPNPALDQVKLVYHSYEKGMQIEICDLASRMIMHEKLEGVETMIILSKISPGIYTVLLKDKIGQTLDRKQLVVVK